MLLVLELIVGLLELPDGAVELTVGLLELPDSAV